MSQNPLAGLPDITFVDTDPESIRNTVIAGYEGATKRTLYPGNPERLFLEGLAYLISVLAGQVDYAAKQNLVAYAEGPHLDHLGAESDTPRLAMLPSATTLRFSLEKPLDWEVEILGATRVSTADGKVVFMTDAYSVIRPGEGYVDVPATAAESGAAANGLLPGQVNRLVDPLPYINSVANIEQTASGADDEQDKEYRLRIPLAREAYTCAGPGGQYESFTKRVHKDIADAGIYTPVPGTVCVCPIMRGGALPTEEVLAAIRNILSPKHVRPLTDTVIVRAPEKVFYTLDGEWYLDRRDEALAGSIGAAVARAVDEYREWQHGKPGRDINPDELVRRVKEAGAKRLDLRSPAFTRLEPYQIARLASMSLTYGGAEDE